MTGEFDEKMRAHSGDSHFLEPEGLWNEILPKDLAARMPWSETVADGSAEIIHVDGQEFRRELPKVATKKVDGLSMMELSDRPAGARDLQARVADLDQEGIWGEVILFEQVYCSFQHEGSAVQANRYMGYKNVMWGSDYPHMEGTFGHTQKTLHELFDDEPAEVSERIRFGAFEELFPHVKLPSSR